MSPQPRTIQSSRDLGAFIYDARTQHNLTQEALAQKANVSRSWLIGLEQGKRPRAEMDKILSLLRALDISLSLQMVPPHDFPSEEEESQDPHVADQPQDKPFLQDSKSTTVATNPVSGGFLMGEGLKNAVQPHLNTSPLFGANLLNQAGLPLSNITPIFGKIMGANMPNFGKIMGANIPNFGQASGITRALDHKEQKKKRTDSQ